MLIGDRNRAIREAKKLSQGDIEKRCGLLRVYISALENGHTLPSVETLEKFARGLEVPLYMLEQPICRWKPYWLDEEAFCAASQWLRKNSYLSIDTATPALLPSASFNPYRWMRPRQRTLSLPARVIS